MKSMLKEMMEKVSSLSTKVHTLKANENICEMHLTQKQLRKEKQMKNPQFNWKKVENQQGIHICKRHAVAHTNAAGNGWREI